MPYILIGGQIMGPDNTVVAEVCRVGTDAGQRHASVLLAALNASERRVSDLRAIRASALSLAESGRPVEDDFRGLANLVARLAEGSV